MTSRKVRSMPIDQKRKELLNTYKINPISVRQYPNKRFLTLKTFLNQIELNQNMMIKLMIRLPAPNQNKL